LNYKIWIEALFRNVKEVAGNPKVKDVLIFSEKTKLLTPKPSGPLSRLAVLLGLLCGMRCGKVRGLNGVIFIMGSIRPITL